jgi:hypothetical protein
VLALFPPQAPLLGAAQGRDRLSPNISYDLKKTITGFENGQ